MDPTQKHPTIFQSENSKMGCSTALVIYYCFAAIMSSFPHVLDFTDMLRSFKNHLVVYFKL
jgi:hypothetical protein